MVLKGRLFNSSAVLIKMDQSDVNSVKTLTGVTSTTVWASLKLRIDTNRVLCRVLCVTD